MFIDIFLLENLSFIYRSFDLFIVIIINFYDKFIKIPKKNFFRIIHIKIFFDLSYDNKLFIVFILNLCSKIRLYLVLTCP